jgi:hypothetical protein
VTATQQSQIRIGITTAVIGGLMLLAFTKLGGQVVLRPELDAMNASIRQDRFQIEQHIQSSESRLERKIDEVHSIALDNLCATTPNHRRCK